MTTINPSNLALKTATTLPLAQAANTKANTAAGAVGSVNNPFPLTNDTWVNWSKDTKPQYLTYNGEKYAFQNTSDKGELVYKAQNNNIHQQLVTISFTGKSKQVQTGTTTEKVQVGTNKVQVGTEKVQTGTNKVQTGTEKVKVGEKTTIVKSYEKSNISLSREIDGQNATGAIGDMLTRGTTQLSDADSFFNGGKFASYQVGSLTGEDNKVTSGKVDPLTQKLGSDDMFLAGDPLVGGKGNNYAAVDVTPQTGYMTVYEDGSDTGRKSTINANADIINAQGNKAFTEYGFVVQDDAGAKTKAVLSGGKLAITAPDGTIKNLQPGETYTVGNASDPAAKFYFADMPGGENGALEKRLVYESYEKPTQAVVNALVANGMSESEAKAKRQTTQATFAFRIPDGQGSYRSSAGVTGAALNKTSNNVKTYYDAHFSKPDQMNLEGQKCIETPVKEAVYEDRPTYKDVPVYTDKPVYKDVPVYENREKPVYSKQYEISKQVTSPLVLDLDGTGIKTTEPNRTMDLDGDGSTETVSWFSGNNGVLAFDANKNGKIDNTGKELLGDASDVDGDGKADGYANGFEALKALANNRLGAASTADGKLDAAEIKALEAKANLRILVGDQSKTLSSLGISQLNLNYTEKASATPDAYGNQTLQFGSFQRTLSNGSTVTRDMNDVWLFKNQQVAGVPTPSTIQQEAPVVSTPAPVVQTPAPVVQAPAPVAPAPAPVSTPATSSPDTGVAAPNSRIAMLSWLKAYLSRLSA